MQWQLVNTETKPTYKEWWIKYQEFMVYRIKVNFGGNSKEIQLNGLIIETGIKSKILLNYMLVIYQYEFQIVEYAQKQFILKINGQDAENLGQQQLQQFQAVEQTQTRTKKIRQLLLSNASTSQKETLDDILKEVDEIQNAINKGQLNNYKSFEFDRHQTTIKDLIKIVELIIEGEQLDSQIEYLFGQLERLRNQYDLLDDIKRQTSQQKEIKNTKPQEIQLDYLDEQQILVQEEDKPTRVITKTVEIEDLTCIICLDKQSCYAAIPCGHQKYCEDCIKIVTDKKVCQLCRQPATGVMKIFK